MRVDVKFRDVPYTLGIMGHLKHSFNGEKGDYMLESNEVNFYFSDTDVKKVQLNHIFM